MLLTELMRYSDEPGRSALVLLLDNESAFDKMQSGFLLQVLEAHGFPEEFVTLIRVMYTGLFAELKVNGHIGTRFDVSNGVRQGCPLSPLLFIIVQDVLLKMIEADETTASALAASAAQTTKEPAPAFCAVRGVEIPGASGSVADGECEYARARSYADDVWLALMGYSELPNVRRIIKQFERISGQRLNVTASTGVVLGDAKNSAPPVGDEFAAQWVNWDANFSEKNLGIVPVPPSAVAKQWEERLKDVEHRCSTMREAGALRGLHARSRYVQAAIASRLYYACRIQVPPAKERNEFLRKMQAAIDHAVFRAASRADRRNYHSMKLTMLQQPYRDGGINHVNLALRMNANWAQFIPRMLKKNAPTWCNFWSPHQPSVVLGSPSVCVASL